MLPIDDSVPLAYGYVPPIDINYSFDFFLILKIDFSVVESCANTKV